MARPTHVSYAVEGWGVGEAWLDGPRLLQLELPRPAGPPRATTHGEHIEQARAGVRRERDEGVPAAAGRLLEQIRRYFSGERVDFGTVALDLSWCSPFQRAVTNALRAVPYGETVSYGELAALAGSPGAQRAAGSFCARNRFPILVPCHRVVAADGLGSYGSLGIEYKRRLLTLETGP